MPGEEQIVIILNSMDRETLKEYFEQNPEDVALFEQMRGKNADIEPLDKEIQKIKDARQLFEESLLRDDVVEYYLSKTPQNTDSGQLYSHDLSSGEDQLIANNVNLFSLDGNIIYYTLYNPAPAFEWDYPVKNEDGTVEIRADGQNKTSRVMIESRHGNEIYTYDIGTGDF